MRATLINPPTLHRWREPPAGDKPCEPYYRQIAQADAFAGDGKASTLPGEHLGLQSIAASARAGGHDIRLVNACAHLHRSLAETSQEIIREDTDLVAFSGPADVFGEIRWLAQDLRRKGLDVPFVLGNDFATLNDTRVLHSTPEIDFVVRGEGEAAFPALLNALEFGTPLSAVSGLVWRKGDELGRNESTPLDIDALERPARDDTTTVVSHGMAASIFAKRGCPYRCSFCTTGQLGTALDLKGSDRWRKKSADSAAVEFLELSAEFGLEHVTIVDDLFVSKDRASRDWAERFAQCLIDAGNKTTFMIDCRIDGVSRDLFGTLVRAGLRRCFIGVESASRDSLGVFDKHYGNTDTAAALSILAELGVDVVLGFIFFEPLSTLQNLAQNVALLRDVGAADYALHLQRVRVYPGTPLEELLRNRGLLEGEFPFLIGVFNDPDVKKVADAIAELAIRVRQALAHPPQDQLDHAGLFATMNSAINDLVSVAPNMSRSEVRTWIEDTATMMQAKSLVRAAKVDARGSSR